MTKRLGVSMSKPWYVLSTSIVPSSSSSFASTFAYASSSTVTKDDCEHANYYLINTLINTLISTYLSPHPCTYSDTSNEISWFRSKRDVSEEKQWSRLDVFVTEKEAVGKTGMPPTGEKEKLLECSGNKLFLITRFDFFHWFMK